MFTNSKPVSNIFFRVEKNIGPKSKLNDNISPVLSLHFVEALTNLVPRAFPLEMGLRGGKDPGDEEDKEEFMASSGLGARISCDQVE